MGFLKKALKRVNKSIKNLASAPFRAVRDVSRGVKSLAQGDFQGALGNVASAGLNVGSFGTISEGGTLIDTSSKREDVGDSISMDNLEKPIVSFLDTSIPSLVLGSDATEEELKKRKTASSSSSSFLGGVSNSSALVV